MMVCFQLPRKREQRESHCVPRTPPESGSASVVLQDFCNNHAASSFVLSGLGGCIDAWMQTSEFRRIWPSEHKIGLKQEILNIVT